MHNCKFSFLTLAITLVMAHCLAAQGEVPPPQPPYLARIPAFTKWQVSVESKDQEEKALTPEQLLRRQNIQLWRPPLQGIVGFKDQRAIKLVYSWGGNRETEEYIVDGIVFKSVSARYPDDVLVLDPQASAHVKAPRYDISDFPQLAWVGADTYQRVVKEGRVLCYLYEHTSKAYVAPPEEVQLAQDEETEAIEVDGAVKKVWVSVKSALPVKYDDGKHVLQYRFTKGGNTPIAYSEPFRKKIVALGLLKK